MIFRYISLFEKICLDISPKDIILTGKFKNREDEVKTIEYNDKGQPVIVTSSGKKIDMLKFRIAKLMPKKDKTKKKESYSSLYENKITDKEVYNLILQLNPIELNTKYSSMSYYTNYFKISSRDMFNILKRLQSKLLSNGFYIGYWVSGK